MSNISICRAGPAALVSARAERRPSRAVQPAGLQQQLAAVARSRFTGSSTTYLSGGNALQNAVEAAAAANGGARVQAR